MVVALASAFGAGLAPRAHAQDWFTTATYQVSFPVEDTKRFTDEISFIGGGIDFRKKLTGGTTAGIYMAWNVFHDRTDGTLDIASGAVTGTQDRYINSFPVMIGLYQYFGNRRSIRPYIGVNGGGFLFVQSFRIGISEFEEDSWEWGAAPEAGFVFPIQTGAWFVINGRYNWSPTVESLAGNDVTLTYYQFNVGFMWEQ
jgi:outer membrane protein W